MSFLWTSDTLCHILLESLSFTFWLDHLLTKGYLNRFWLAWSFCSTIVPIRGEPPIYSLILIVVFGWPWSEIYLLRQLVTIQEEIHRRICLHSLNFHFWFVYLGQFVENRVVFGQKGGSFGMVYCSSGQWNWLCGFVGFRLLCKELFINRLELLFNQLIQLFQKCLFSHLLNLLTLMGFNKAGIYQLCIMKLLIDFILGFWFLVTFNLSNTLCGLFPFQWNRLVVVILDDTNLPDQESVPQSIRLFLLNFALVI